MWKKKFINLYEITENKQWKGKQQTNSGKEKQFEPYYTKAESNKLRVNSMSWAWDDHQGLIDRLLHIAWY